jgi:hypothetical protein
VVAQVGHDVLADVQDDQAQVDAGGFEHTKKSVIVSAGRREKKSGTSSKV